MYGKFCNIIPWHKTSTSNWFGTECTGHIHAVVVYDFKYDWNKSQFLGLLKQALQKFVSPYKCTTVSSSSRWRRTSYVEITIKENSETLKQNQTLVHQVFLTSAHEEGLVLTKRNIKTDLSGMLKQFENGDSRTVFDVARDYQSEPQTMQQVAIQILVYNIAL